MPTSEHLRIEPATRSGRHGPRLRDRDGGGLLQDLLEGGLVARLIGLGPAPLPQSGRLQAGSGEGITAPRPPRWAAEPGPPWQAGRGDSRHRTSELVRVLGSKMGGHY